MAEAPSPKPGHPYEVAMLLVAILAGLFLLWWVRGGPQHASLQRIFLSQPQIPSAPGK